MPRVCRNSLLLAILAFASNCLLWGQAQIGSIVGTVLVVRGDFPNHPVLVELQLHHATINSTYCDGQGRYGFFGLGTDVYHVIVRDDAYDPVDEVASLDLMSSSQVMVQIRLTRKQSSGQAQPATAPVSGGNPYLIDLSQYKRQFPKTAVKEFDKGVDADKEHRTDDAIRHYEKAVKQAPDFYPARNNLGSDYLAKSHFPDAQNQFEEALRLNKDDAQAYFNLGNVLSLTGKLSEAEKVLKQGLQRRPDSAFGHFLLGSLYSRAGHGMEAERNLQDALKLDRNMPQAYLQLVNLYVQENRKSEAISELQAFLHAFPDGVFTPKAKQVLKKLQGEQQAAASR